MVRTLEYNSPSTFFFFFFFSSKLFCHSDGDGDGADDIVVCTGHTPLALAMIRLKELKEKLNKKDVKLLFIYYQATNIFNNTHTYIVLTVYLF